MASLNRVTIMGNLGQDPELRYTQNQTPVCTFSVATTDYRTGQDGQKLETTEWHRIVVWGRMGENCSKYLAKGRSVLVEGRLQTRNWEDKSGQKRYVTEIIAQNVQFVGGASRGDRAGAQQHAQNEYGGGHSMDNNMDTGFGGPETAGLDDIPF